MRDEELIETMVSEKQVFDGRVLKVFEDTVRLPSGQTSTREIVRHPGAVAIVAQYDDEVLFVRQFRYALGLITCEIPAGKLEIGEAPELCALRELREETGYSGELECWGEFASSPGFSNEIIHIYGASNLRWEPLAQDEDEFLHVVRMPCEEAFAKLAAGEWLDAKTTLGLLLLRQKRHSF